MTGAELATTGAVARPADALLALRQAVAAADEHRSELAEAGDWAALIEGLASLKPLLADLRTLANAIEDDAARLMPSKREELPGIGVVERKKGTDRKAWQSEDLLRELVLSVSTADENGEKHTDPDELLDRLKAAVPFTGSLGWRVTALRAMGLDPDEWCETKPGRVSLQFHGGDK